MRYLVMLLMICSFALSQSKEQQRYVIYEVEKLVPVDNPINVAHPETPQQKKSLIMLDTFTGKNFLLTETYVKKIDSTNRYDVFYSWKPITFSKIKAMEKEVLQFTP